MTIKSANFWTLAVITVMLGLALGYFLGRNFPGNYANPHAFDDLEVREHRWTSVHTKIANDELDAFRQRLAFLNLSIHPGAKSMCIVHDSTSAIDYSTKFFPDWVSTHNVKGGYKWSVGLYPEICREQVQGSTNPKPRISIFMIPTMQSTDPKTPKDIIDYFTAAKSDDSLYYIPKGQWPKPGEKKAQTALPDDFIYDQGTIFP